MSGCPNVSDIGLTYLISGCTHLEWVGMIDFTDEQFKRVLREIPSIRWAKRSTPGIKIFRGTYDGEWNDGEMNGDGTMTWPNGQKYVGHFNNGKLDGKGTMTWPDGRTYLGDFKQDHLEGKGTMTWANERRRYVGDFHDDKMHGKGTLTFADGRMYVGDFEGGKLAGNGTFTIPNGKLIPNTRE